MLLLQALWSLENKLSNTMERLTQNYLKCSDFGIMGIFLKQHFLLDIWKCCIYFNIFWFWTECTYNVWLENNTLICLHRKVTACGPYNNGAVKGGRVTNPSWQM